MSYGRQLLIVCWSALTVLYAAAIAYRMLVSSSMPGLATVAGVGAVAAVWIYGYDLWRGSRERAEADAFGHSGTRHIAVLAVLAIVVVANVTLIVGSVRRGDGFPLMRALLTFCLTLFMRHQLIQLLGK